MSNLYLVAYILPPRPSMRLIKYLIFVFVITGTLLFVSACKKKQQFTEESAQDAVDTRVAMGELDELVKNINIIIAEQFTLRGKPSGGGSTSVCGVEFDTTLLTQGTLSMLFKGEVCGKRKISGRVVVQFDNYPLTKWKMKSAIASITLTNYLVVNVADGRKWQFDGLVIITNQAGGTFYDMMYLNQPYLIFDLKTEKLKVSYTTEEYAFLYAHRRMNYTYRAPVITCLVEGLANVNGNDNTECWGENRKAQQYNNVVTQAYIWNSTCGAISPLNGETQLHFEEKAHVLTSTFGVDANGDKVADNVCPFGLKVNWSYRNKTGNRIFAYY